MNKSTSSRIRRIYDRNAAIYDRMEGLMERSAGRNWRTLLWSKIEGDAILEAGVGTGKNFAYYPAGAHVTAIDFSPRMLARARARAAKDKIDVKLEQMDIESLDFADSSFDTIVSSFVFCSVPDPHRGLAEIERVCKPGGKVVLLEHVLSSNRVLAVIMHAVNPITVRMMGANIDRRTVENVAASGLHLEQVTDLSAGIFKLIEARKSAT